jgi:hypothetical protein
MAVSTRHGLVERLRSLARPECRTLPRRTRRRIGARRPTLRGRQHGARDDLDDAKRVAGRPRRADHQPLGGRAAGALAAPASRRRPGGASPPSHDGVRARACRRHRRLRADVRLWPVCSRLELRGSRSSHRESDRSRRRDDASPRQQPSPRIRGGARGGARHVASVGACFRGPVLGRWRPARDD